MATMVIQDQESANNFLVSTAAKPITAKTDALLESRMEHPMSSQMVNCTSQKMGKIQMIVIMKMRGLIQFFSERHNESSH